MSIRNQQEGYLASIAQAFDVGDFDYLTPEELHSLDALIAKAWKTFKQGEEIDSEISEIEKTLGHTLINSLQDTNSAKLHQEG